MSEIIAERDATIADLTRHVAALQAIIERLEDRHESEPDETLEADAWCWRYVRDHLLVTSKNFNGQKSYSFSPLYASGATIDEAINNAIDREKITAAELFARHFGHGQDAKN